MHGRLGKDVLKQGAEAISICDSLGLKYYAPWKDENIDLYKVIDMKPNRRVMNGYVTKDDSKVDQSRALCNLTGDTSSSGVGWEMGRMYYKNHRPIVAVAPRMCDGLLANFTTIKASKLCRTQKQALTWLKRRLKRNK